MRISITPRADVPCVDPTIAFDVTVHFQRGRQLPLDMSVQVHAEDGRLLGVAHVSGFGATERFSLDAADLGSNWPEAAITARALLVLSPKQVDHVEGVRARNRKHDVVLTCSIETRLLASKTALATLTPNTRAGAGLDDPQVVTYKQYTTRDPFYSQLTNMWVLSGDNGRAFLERETFQQAVSTTIPAGDWVHDYAGPWRATRYLVVELPQPELFTSGGNVEDRVNAAIEAVKNAAASLTKGEWTEVIEDLRPAWEVLKKDADIGGLLKRDGYTADAIAAFEAIVQSQFTLASKFAHRLDQSKKNINPEIRASREDAYACYASAVSLVNLVARKLARLKS